MTKYYSTAITMLVRDPGVVVTEYLRYASALDVLDKSHTGRPPYSVEARFPRPLQENWALVTMRCPDGMVREVWARQNLERLKSFGVLAVAWSDGKNGVTILGQNRYAEKWEVG